MKPLPILRLDFVKAGSGSKYFGWLLLSTNLFVTVGLGYWYQQLNIEIGMHELAISSERRSGNGSIFMHKKNEASERQSADLKQAESAMEHLNVPWDALFRAVETSLNDEIALLSIQPEAAQRTLTLTGEAKDLPTLLNYVRRLGMDAKFRDVQLKSHKTESLEKLRPIRFVLTMSWSEVAAKSVAKAMSPAISTVDTAIILAETPSRTVWLRVLADG